jgi:hypothetical protein
VLSNHSVSSFQPSARHPLVVCLIAFCLASSAFAQNTPAAALLAQSGWQALNAGQPETAANAFRQALDLDPKNARLHHGAAIAAYVLRRDDEAKRSVERALELDRSLVPARELLGRVLYRSGDLHGAIAAVEPIEFDADASPSLGETLARWRREAELRDRMHVAGASSFTVAFEGPDDAALAEKALASLEQASARIGATLSYYPTASISVVLYTNEQFRDITRSPSWAAGAFDGTIRIPMRGALANQRELDRVLAHEYMHALVHEIAPRGVPAWLDEGLAVVLEIGQPDRRNADRQGCGSRTTTTDASNTAVQLGTLTRSFRRLADREARDADNLSACAAERLLDDGGPVAVMNLLRDVGEGAGFEQAFAHRMNRSLAEFEASLRR